MVKKVAVVTGGSKGIGLAIINKFESESYRVYNLDLEQGPHGEFIKCNVSQASQVDHAISTIMQQEGRIDVLLCNAGIHYSGTIEDTSEADFDRVFAINVKGAYTLIKTTIPIMKRQEHGVIVITGSDQSMIAKHNSFAYNLSKHALASIAKTTALDYAAYNIRANVVCPGTIDTPLYQNAIDNYCAKSGANKEQVHKEEAAMQPLGRVGQPEEVAELAYFLANDKASFITGSLQMIDGGYTTQ